MKKNEHPSTSRADRALHITAHGLCSLVEIRNHRYEFGTSSVRVRYEFGFYCISALSRRPSRQLVICHISLFIYVCGFCLFSKLVPNSYRTRTELVPNSYRTRTDVSPKSLFLNNQLNSLLHYICRETYIKPDVERHRRIFAQRSPTNFSYGCLQNLNQHMNPIKCFRIKITMK